MAGTRIQLKRGTATEWTDSNFVLREGEVGLELDTGKFKWGDGTTAWNDLAYIGGSQPPIPFVQDADPGAVGFGSIWVDTDSEPALLKIRNGDDDGWVLVDIEYVLRSSQDAGNNQINNLAEGTAGSDAATVSQLLPSGWTQAGDPATVNSQGGGLDLETGALSGTDGDTGFFSVAVSGGITSAPNDSPSCFTAVGDAGATASLNANGLPVINLPEVDPEILGALWNDGGTPAISAGP